MCGIHGVINLRSVFSTDAQKFVEQGFVAGSLRGMDSSGVFQINKTSVPFVCKGAEDGTTFIQGVVPKRFITDAANSRLTVCHVRAATRGKISADNAHPFTVDAGDKKRLIGVHNGTLYAWESKKKKGKDVEVDSNWAMQHIAEEGADAFEDFSGAFAFAWWDERTPGQFFMARNKERPMHFVVTKDKAQMYFASEAGMLAWLTDRNNITTEDEIYQLEEGKLYTFDLEGKEVSFTKTNLPSFRPSATVSNVHSSRQGYNYGGSNHWNAQTGRYESRPSYSNDSDWGVLEDEEGDYYNWRNRGSRYATKADADGVPEYTQYKIKAIGEVLSTACDRLNTRGVDVGKKSMRQLKKEMKGRTAEQIVADALEEAKLVPLDATTTVLKDMEQQDKLFDDAAPDSWYTTSTATSVEQQEAKSMGVMGELTWLEGVVYDTGGCAVVGEIDLYESGVGKIKYDAELRAQSAASAHRNWINNKHPSGRNGDWVCIIGVGEDKILNKKMFVVSPLTAEAKAKMYAS